MMMMMMMMINNFELARVRSEEKMCDTTTGRRMWKIRKKGEGTSGLPIKEPTQLLVIILTTWILDMFCS
jgi:hypothetical protein